VCQDGCILYTLVPGALVRMLVLLVCGSFGVVMDAPYLDPHGQHDAGMRRGRPQQLEPRQLGARRSLCLGHGLGPTVCQMRNYVETVIYGSYY
jgi:hypothetical protein